MVKTPRLTAGGIVLVGGFVAIFLISVFLAGFASAATSNETNDNMSVMHNSDCAKGDHCTISFGGTHNEWFYYNQQYNYYFTSTSAKGELKFQLKNIEDADQGDDLDLYVYNADTWEELCRSRNGAGEDELCTWTKSNTNNMNIAVAVYAFYIYKYWGTEYATCDIVTSVKEATCSSNSQCSNLDWNGTWSSTKCIGGNMQKERDIIRGVCSSGKCAERSSKETKFVSGCDHGCADGSTTCYECSSDSHCNSATEKCSNHNCVAKTCSDYSLSSCSSSGSKKKENGKIYQCNQKTSAALCWEVVASKGDDNYCSFLGCDRNEYDCDYTLTDWVKGNCNSGLVCSGPTGDSGSSTYDGCCYNTEYWDTSSKSCKGCSDFGLQSCSSSQSGSLDKQNDKIYQCVDKYPHSDHNGQVWCWDAVSALGDDNYCKLGILCDRGEYDCDWFSWKNQCADGLYCDADATGASDGCCTNDIEKWDHSSYLCKKVDGQACTAGNGAVECYSGYCLHGYCYKDSYKIGDGYCDSGELCSNSPADCGKCDDVSCSADSECQSKHCVHGKCYKDPYKIGDGYCDMAKGENNVNSPSDCFGKMIVVEILSYPVEVVQGQAVQVKARVKNEGTYNGNLKLEAGIAPDYWNEVSSQCAGSSVSALGFEVQSYFPILKCCPGNEYYGAVNITLAPGESQDVTFNLLAPTIHSVDACNGNRTAWDDSYSLIVGLYKQCGNGYENYQAECIKVKERYCYADTDCGSGEYCKKGGSSMQGVCAIKQCVNECPTLGAYVCQGSGLAICQNINSDKCLEKKVIDYCSGDYVCQEGRSSCVYVPPKTKLGIDYTGGKDIRVNKQPGDILKIKLSYGGQEFVSLDYDHSAFSSMDCPDNFTMTADKTCSLRVGTKNGVFEVGMKDRTKGTVRVINESRMIIVTDIDRLMSRYDNNKEEVNAVLKEAYLRASEEEGVVYNLGDYTDNSKMWKTLTEYNGGQYAVN